MPKISKSLHSSKEIKVKALKKRITEEIFVSLGFSRNSWLASIGGIIFRKPAERFAQIAARFEEEIPLSGLHGGAQKILADFPLEVTVWGVEHIPKSGPVLIISNHPGAYDSLALVSCIPRKDLKLLVSDIPFTRALSNSNRHLIYVDFTAFGGMQALRDSVNHLSNHGALLLFAHGEVEPDPEFMSGATESFTAWSPSIEIMLRKVPQTRVVIAIASGVFLPQFIHHPLTRIRHNPASRQKLAEFLQVIHQLVAKSSEKANVHISFSESNLTLDTSNFPVMPTLIKNARQLLKEHCLRVSKFLGNIN